MSQVLSLNTIVVAADHSISSHLDSEAVILDLDQGIYFGLNEVGARVWELIQEPRSLAEIRDVLREEYEVEAEECERDLQRIVAELAARGLAEVRGPAS
jgi:hypothetical protein